MLVKFTCDDVCSETIDNFKYWDYVKENIPEIEVIAFVIADKIDESFDDWYKKHKDWVEIGVHCYNHDKVQEGWRDDQEHWINLAYCSLKSYLPERPLYRPPGFRFLPKTERILKDIGFCGVAHQGIIKYFDTGEIIQTVDTHCTVNEYKNPIGKIWKNIVRNYRLSL